MEDALVRKSKRVLMSFAFREGILTGLIVLIPFVVVVVALIYTVWSGSGGNVMCLLSLLLLGIMIVILAAISSRSRGKSG
ncbi:MAG: hypothetical protein V3T94_02165 [Thermoplasmata archaeon]